MGKSVQELIAEAKTVVPSISPKEASALAEQGDVLIVDVREPAELEASGKAAGALHVPRGMLEFKADPTSAYHDAAFAPDKTVVLYCGSGGRAALAGKVLLDLGYRDVRNLGGFKDWADAGLPVEHD